MKNVKEEKGFTLVEIIVTIAIALIVFGSIMSFLITSTTFFRNTNNEANVQNEAQLASNRIHDMLVNASAGVSYFVSSSGNTAVYQDQADDSSETSKKLYIYDWQDDSNGASDNTKIMVYSVEFNKSTEELNYKSYTYSEAEAEPSDEELLAQYVTDFKVVLYNPAAGTANTVKQNQVWYQIQFELNGRTYTTENTVTLRNNISVNKDLKEVSVTPIPYVSTVTSVTVNPASAQIVQGGNAQFTATVTGVNHPNTEVTWKIEGATDTGTNIDENGLVTLGHDETSQEIRVIATSKADPTVSNATASVVSTSYMTGVTLTPSTDFNNTYAATKKVTLTVNGYYLKGEILSAHIAEGQYYTITDSKGTAVTDCTVTADSSVMTVSSDGKTASCQLTIDCSAALTANILNKARTLTVTMKYPYEKSINSTITFQTPKKQPAKKQITGIEIRKSDATIHGNENLWRGETAVLEVYIKRGNGDFVKASADGSCSFSWTFTDNQNSSQFASMSGADSSTMSLTVTKHSAETDKGQYLEYYKTRKIQVKVTVTDLADTGKSKTSSTYNFTVPAVSMSLNTIEGYDDNVVFTNWYYNYSEHFIKAKLKVSGIVYDGNEIGNYMTWKGARKYTIDSVASDETGTTYTLSLWPTGSERDYDDYSIYLALGDPCILWYDTYSQGSYDYIYYTPTTSNTYLANSETKTGYYIPTNLYRGDYINSEGIVYQIWYDDDWNKCLTINGSDYQRVSGRWSSWWEKVS